MARKRAGLPTARTVQSKEGDLPKLRNGRFYVNGKVLPLRITDALKTGQRSVMQSVWRFVRFIKWGWIAPGLFWLTGGGPMATACTGSIAASMNPIIVSSGVTTGITTLNATASCAASIYVVGPGLTLGTGSGLLASTGGPLTFSATTGNWVVDGTEFYLQPEGDTNPASTMAVVKVRLATASNLVCTGSVSASPNPIVAASGTANGTTTASGSANCAASIYVVPSGQPISSSAGQLTTSAGPGTLYAVTGNWVSDGTQFYLQPGGDPNPAHTIDVVTVQVNTAAVEECWGTLLATPNPIVVTTGTTVGTTVLTGSATCAVSIYAVGPGQTLTSSSALMVSTGGAGSFSAVTGTWVNSGTQFYLQPAGDPDPADSLAMVTVTLLTVPVPAATTTKDYIYMNGKAVAIENH